MSMGLLNEMNIAKINGQLQNEGYHKNDVFAGDDIDHQYERTEDPKIPKIQRKDARLAFFRVVPLHHKTQEKEKLPEYTPERPKINFKTINIAHSLPPFYLEWSTTESI